MASESGKEEKSGYQGKIRIEFQNNRIIILDENDVIRIVIGRIEDDDD